MWGEKLCVFGFSYQNVIILLNFSAKIFIVISSWILGLLEIGKDH